jgi:hypothetical protein
VLKYVQSFYVATGKEVMKKKSNTIEIKVILDKKLQTRKDFGNIKAELEQNNIRLSVRDYEPTPQASISGDFLIWVGGIVISEAAKIAFKRFFAYLYDNAIKKIKIVNASGKTREATTEIICNHKGVKFHIIAKSNMGSEKFSDYVVNSFQKIKEANTKNGVKDYYVVNGKIIPAKEYYLLLKKKSDRKSTKQHLNKLIKKWWVWAIVASSLVAIGVGVFMFMRITEQNRLDEENRRIDEAISECVTETRRSLLGFASLCYEEHGREVPEDVMRSDMNRVDRILVQDAYSTCMARAAFSREEHWDLNDVEPLNGRLDGSRHAEFIDREYGRLIDECRIRHVLMGNHEPDFLTLYRIRLVGWQEPIDHIQHNNNTSIANIYNNDGRIEGGTEVLFPFNMSWQELLADIDGTVGGMAAREFREQRIHWWH